MPWAAFCDHFDDDPDLIGMGTDAIALHVCAVTWCARHLTDGHIPANVVSRLPGGASKSAIDELTKGEKAWWIKGETHYTVRSYLKYNPSREQVLGRRKASYDRVKAFRQGKRNAACNAVTPPVTKRVTEDVCNAECNATPLPLPLNTSKMYTEDPTTSTSQTGASPPGKNGEATPDVAGVFGKPTPNPRVKDTKELRRQIDQLKAMGDK